MSRSLQAVFAAICLLQTTALADGSCPSQLVINVRAVRAMEPTRDHAAGFVRVDSRIRDLGSKLTKLPYRSFSLVANEKRLVPMRKRETIALTDGQTVIVRPLYADDQRIGMWIKWIDGSGSDVLDTKMHFDYSESMIAGTEHDPASGLLLAIDVTPARQTRADWP